MVEYFIGIIYDLDKEDFIIYKPFIGIIKFIEIGKFMDIVDQTYYHINLYTSYI